MKNEFSVTVVFVVLVVSCFRLPLPGLPDYPSAGTRHVCQQKHGRGFTAAVRRLQLEQKLWREIQ